MPDPSLRYLSRADVEAVALTGVEVLGLLEDVFRAKREGAIALFVVDDVPQYRHHVEQGYFDGYPADPIELCEALDPQADLPAGLRVFVPLGIALEDVAVAAEVHRRAAAARLGTDLPL